MKKALWMLFLWSIVAVGCPSLANRSGALLDVNPTSPTFNRYIVPEDFLGQVSAWYFGHST